jgi:hypothetical protein
MARVLARNGSPTSIIGGHSSLFQSARTCFGQECPHVGIFWFIQKPGSAPELVALSVALQLGKAYGIYIDGHEDHISLWRTIKRIMRPLLHDSGPKDSLRGRILFNSAMKHFEVELTRQLLAPQFRAELLNYFRLPEGSTVFKPNPQFAETRFTFGLKDPQERVL